MVSKFKVKLKLLLQPEFYGPVSEPEFYGGLVYEFIKNVSRIDFPDQFRKIIIRYKRMGYNINVILQSEW